MTRVYVVEALLTRRDGLSGKQVIGTLSDYSYARRLCEKLAGKKLSWGIRSLGHLAFGATISEDDKDLPAWFKDKQMKEVLFIIYDTTLDHDFIFPESDKRFELNDLLTEDE